MTHELLKQGKLPNLAKLIAGGTFADSVITVFPSKTAPGHASLWTGAPPRINGISGNRMPRTPRSQFTILESVSGFDAMLKAEPLWLAAARSGRRALMTDGPFGPGPSGRTAIFQGYGSIIGGDGVVTGRSAPPRAAQGWSNLPKSDVPPLEITFHAGPAQFFGLLIDDPADPVRGYDTVVVTRERDAIKAQTRLKPGPSARPGLDKWSPTVEAEVANQSSAATRLRLFELKADGTDFLLYFTRPVRALVSDPGAPAALRKAAGAFVGNGASGLYRQGVLGIPIFRGGDGVAEQRYLETVLLTQRHLMDAARWAMENLPWDLLFTYTPLPDEAEHLWRGYLEPQLPGFRQEAADRVRPLLEEAYRSSDEFLGMLVRLRPQNTVLALVADHGMEGVNKAVAINTVLRRAGLLALNRQGRVELSKTRALYPVANNGYILINTTDRKEGIVSSEERPKVVSQLRRALQEVRDGGRQIVTAIYDSQTDGEKMGIGGEAGGDIYLDLLPGYDFDARLNASDLIVQREPYGTHGFNPARMSMRTIMVLNGPGVAQGKKLPEARTIDFAPTLAELLGISRPRDATGRVLAEALTPR